MGIYDSGNAAQADFFGETVEPGAADAFTGIEGRAPILTADQIAIDRERKKQWLANQGLAEDGVTRLGNYGTAGNGTSTGHQVVSRGYGASGQFSDNWTSVLGPDGQPVPGAPITEHLAGDDTGNVVGAIVPGQDTHGSMAYSPLTRASSGISVTDDGTTYAGGSVGGGLTVGAGGSSAGGGSGSGGLLSAQTAQGTGMLRDDIAAARQGGQDAMGVAADNAANMNPLVNRALTQTAANQAGAALGPASTIDQSLADRGLADYQGAQASSRAVLDKLMNGPSTTARIGSQVLRNQLALSRSAAGGAGAGQMALQNAQAQAPELMAQAAQSAVAEDMQKATAAGQVAAGQTQAALGARGQDVDVAKANQSAGMRLQDNISQLTGQQLNLNEANTELLGRMATDLAKQDFDYSQLDAAQQQKEFDRWVAVYGIDANIAAAAKLAAAAGGDKGILDYLMPIAGGLAQLGMGAL